MVSDGAYVSRCIYPATLYPRPPRHAHPVASDPNPTPLPPRCRSRNIPPSLPAYYAHQVGGADEAGSSRSPGGAGGGSADGGAGSSGPAAPFQGVPEVTPEVWSSVTGDGGQHSPLTVGVFFLDRFSEGFAAALRAAESAAELAVARRGSAGGVGFVWADAPCQEGFARDLGVSDPSVSGGEFFSFFFLSHAYDVLPP